MPIHIIGIVHLDHRGPSLLKRALTYEKPDIITVESSEPCIALLEQV